MTDKRERELERKAKSGDHDALLHLASARSKLNKRWTVLDLKVGMVLVRLTPNPHARPTSGPRGPMTLVYYAKENSIWRIDRITHSNGIVIWDLPGVPNARIAGPDVLLYPVGNNLNVSYVFERPEHLVQMLNDGLYGVALTEDVNEAPGRNKWAHLIDEA